MSKTEGQSFQESKKFHVKLRQEVHLYIITVYIYSEPEDFEFYERIGVPPPTFSPEERMRRRMSFLNDRNFHKRKCDLTGEGCVSLFPEDAGVPVYSPKAWWSDEWDAIEYGQDYDFSKPFFEQFKKLMRRVPQFSLQSQYNTLVNSDYTMMGTYNKNCYLVVNTQYSDDCLYTTFCSNSKSCMDVYMCHESELCFQSIGLKKCNRVIYSVECENSYNISFSKNLRGCHDCFGCFNLRNKSYQIFNKQYTKEEYEKEIQKYNTTSYSQVTELLGRFWEENKKYPKLYMEGTQNANVSGNYLYESKNAENCFDCTGMEDSKHCQLCHLKPTRDSYDMTFWGGGARFIYDCMGAGGGQNNIKFSIDAWTEATNIEYSYHIVAPNNNLFGCIGLRNKEYCILNKQYSEGEYKETVERIKKQMMDIPYVDRKGRRYAYGEFFPSELSFFGYNETLAYSYLPLKKQEAEEMGLNWKEMRINKHEITRKSSELPDMLPMTDDSILKDVIEDESSGRAYQVVPSELRLLRQLKVPLPRKHPNERHFDRVGKRNPMRLWERKTEDGMDVLTSYAPDRPEKIYSKEEYEKLVV